MPHGPHALASLLLVLTALGAQDPAFLPGPLEKARASAKERQRALVIDFSHDAVAPCRRLRDETWQAPELWRAIGEVGDVIRIDPEVETAAAAEFKVVAYPTIVVLGKDGAECGRVLGFVAAGELRHRVLESIDPPPVQWEARAKYAAALARKKDLDGASRHYLWLWDEGQRHDPDLQYRRDELLDRIARFGKRHPPTLAAMQQRREALLAKVLGADPDHESTSSLISMTTRLCDFDTQLALHAAVPQATWDAHSYAFSQLASALLPELVKQARFPEAVPFVGDPIAKLQEEERMFGGAGVPAALRQQLEASRLSAQKLPLTVLFAVGDARAQPLADRMLEIDGSPRTWLLILGAAKDAGAEVVCHDWAVKALQALPEKDHARVRAFLKRR